MYKRETECGDASLESLYLGGRGKEDPEFKASLGYDSRPCCKGTTKKDWGCVAQMVEGLLRKQKALSLNPSTAKEQQQQPPNNKKKTEAEDI
jgi:hypothetical protein